MRMGTQWLLLGIGIAIVSTTLWLMGEFWQPVAVSVAITGYYSIIYYWLKSKRKVKEQHSG